MIRCFFCGFATHAPACVDLESSSEFGAITNRDAQHVIRTMVGVATLGGGVLYRDVEGCVRRRRPDLDLEAAERDVVDEIVAAIGWIVERDEGDRAA